MVTHMNVPHWRDDETLWNWAIRTDPTDWRSTDQLVEHYLGNDDWEKAAPLLAPIELFSPKTGLKAHLHKAKLLVMQCCQARYIGSPTSLMSLHLQLKWV